MSLHIRKVSEFKRKNNIHYQVYVKDDLGYFLCKGMEDFARHPVVGSESEVSCRLCRSIFRGRGLKEHGEL